MVQEEVEEQEQEQLVEEELVVQEQRVVGMGIMIMCFRSSSNSRQG